jgi:fatty acid synthase
VCGVCRWDGCFIRLLDGMLQASSLGNSADYTLRIPTKIRHLAILDASPAIPAGSQGGALYLTYPCKQANYL